MLKLGFFNLQSVANLFLLGAFIVFTACSSRVTQTTEKIASNLSAVSSLVTLASDARQTVNLNNFEKVKDFSCSEVASRYWTITEESSYIGRRKEYKKFFSQQLLDEALVNNIFKFFDGDGLFFTEKEKEKIKKDKRSNLIADLLNNNCSWYDNFFNLYSKKAQGLVAWYDSQLLSGKLTPFLKQVFLKTKASLVEELEKKLDQQWLDINLKDALAGLVLPKDFTKYIKTDSQFKLLKIIQSRYEQIKKVFKKYPYKRYTDTTILTEALLSTKENVLSSLIADKKEEKKHTYLSMLVGTLDAHSHYTHLTKDTRNDFVNSMGHAGLGVRIECFSESCLVDKVLEKGASFGRIKAGDLIFSSDSLIKKDLSFREFINLGLKGKKGSLAELKILRLVGEKEVNLNISITRSLLQANRFESKILKNKTAYIKLGSFYARVNGFSSASEDFISALSELDPQSEALVIDLQGNPGGSVYEVSKILASLIVTSKFASFNASAQRHTCGPSLEIREKNEDSVLVGNNGEISLHIQGEATLYMMPTVTYLRADSDASKPNYEFYCNQKPYFSNKPIVVLIDEGSASASEILSLGLQEAGVALVVGDSHSFGKGTGQISVNDDSLRLTEFLWGSFLGKSIQSVGVSSDITLNFSQKLKEKEEEALLEKNMPRALPVLGDIGTGWEADPQTVVHIKRYYSAIKKWMKLTVAQPLAELSKLRQEKIKKELGVESKSTEESLENLLKDLVITEVLNILQDWKALFSKEVLSSQPLPKNHLVVPKVMSVPVTNTEEKNWNNWKNDRDEEFYQEDFYKDNY